MNMSQKSLHLHQKSGGHNVDNDPNSKQECKGHPEPNKEHACSNDAQRQSQRKAYEEIVTKPENVSQTRPESAELAG